jgi:hypothetical protein
VTETDKIAAVHQYLNEELNPSTIENHFDSGQMAHIFEVKTTRSHTTIVKNEFLENNSAQAIPGILRKFLLAEHLKECNFPIVVTNSGLTE